MRQFLTGSAALLLALAGAAMAGEGVAKDAPWLVKVAKADAAAVQAALQNLDGVASVTMDGDTAKVVTKDGALLSKTVLAQALGGPVESLTEPRWAQMDVTVVQASGGA